MPHFRCLACKTRLYRAAGTDRGIADRFGDLVARREALETEP